MPSEIQGGITCEISSHEIPVRLAQSLLVRATGELSLRALDGLTLDLNFIDALRLNVE